MIRLKNRIAKLEGPGDHNSYGIKYWEKIIFPDGTVEPAFAVTADNIFEQRPDETREEFSARVLPLVQPHLTMGDMTDAHLDRMLAALRLRIDALQRHPNFVELPDDELSIRIDHLMRKIRLLKP